LRTPIILGASLLLQAGTALAVPREPWPPLPEFTQVLYQQTFDEAYRYGNTNAQVILNGYTFDESWSGYALRRSGPVIPFLIPGMDSSGCTNLMSNTGAIRLWFQPDWSSASLPGGTGPGATAVLAEIGAASANQSVGIWSLQVSADGSVLSLVAQSDSGPVQLVSAQVSWQAGGWHCLVVNYDPTGIALGLDDQWVAQSTATLVIPPAAGVLALGSTLTGNASAGGDQAAALKADGTVVQWGHTNSALPTGLADVTAISAGFQHFLALRTHGTVVAWGNSNCPANYVPAGLSGVTAIGAGWNHNVALLDNGTLAVWGLNAANLNWNLTNMPAGLPDVAAISVGALHGVALRSDGTVVAWGCNTGGETNVPSGLSDIIAVAAGQRIA
jgi:hypothetical protein